MGRTGIGGIVAVGVILCAWPSRADLPEDERGGAGESCRARADCKHGLKCIDNKCVDEHEGESCAASSDCGTLKCIDNKCVNPNARVRPPEPQTQTPQTQTQTPPPPQPRSMPEPIGGGEGHALGAPIEPPPSHAFADWLHFRIQGLHPFVGLTIAGGFLNGGYSASEGSLWGSGVDGAFLLALRGGVRIDRHEIALEIAPFTQFWDLRVASGPAFEANASYAYYLPLLTRSSGVLSWPLRVGVGVLAGGDNTNGNVFFEARVDVIGVALQLGHVVIEAHAPSFRYALTNGHVEGIAVEGVTTHYLSFFFGLSASYVF